LQPAFNPAKPRHAVVLPSRKRTASGTRDRGRSSSAHRRKEPAMSPSLIHLIHASAYHAARRSPPAPRPQLGSPAMTIRVTTTRRRAGALGAHAYSIPVVRELPMSPAEPVGDRTW
jgi:hypothetical protein